MGYINPQRKENKVLKIFPKISISIERWKFNKEFGIYVSNKGKFKNQYKKDLPIQITHDGYCAVKTLVGIRNAHRVVMLTWRPTADAENLTVDHLDHNKRNNELLNLEWVSVKENNDRAQKDFCGVTDEKYIIIDKGHFTYDEAVNYIYRIKRKYFYTQNLIEATAKGKIREKIDQKKLSCFGVTLTYII